MVVRPYAHLPGLLVDVKSGAEWTTPPHDGRFRSCIVQNGTERLIRLSLTFVPESGALHIFVEAPRSSRKPSSPPGQPRRKRRRRGREAVVSTQARVQRQR